MPVWPKSIFTFRASLLTTRTARRLRKKNIDIPDQHQAFRSLVQQLATTSFWKPAGIEPDMSYAQFSSRLTPRKYENLAPAIEKMKQGEANVLWPGQCRLYSTSPSTSAPGKPSEPKHLPVTPALLAHFHQAGMDSLLYYTARVGRSDICRGRHLLLGGPTGLKPLAPGKTFSPSAGNLGAILAQNLSPSVEKHFYEPGREIAQMPDWNARLAAIVSRTKPLDLTLLAGIPSWVLRIAKILREADTTGATSGLSQLWPKLECFVHSGESIAPFAEELRQVLGAKVNFQEVYPTTEALVAAQDGEARAGLRLITNAGVFYEFLPVEDFDDGRLAHLGSKIVPLEGVRVGVDYAMLVTTPAGLCRYPMERVVRFNSTEPPRLLPGGLLKQPRVLSSFGERVTEKDVADALLVICERYSWTIVNFHVAPLFTNPLLGTTRGRHEWWVELKPGTTITPTGPQIAAGLDFELRRVNRSYDVRRSSNLEAPIVRLVMPGVFERWMRNEGKWDAWYAIPGCCNDRQIADPLAEIAQFAKD